MKKIISGLLVMVFLLVFGMNTFAANTWQPYALQDNNMYINGFYMDSQNPKIMYALIMGNGVMKKSIDGGKTWKELGVPFSSQYRSYRVCDSNSNFQICAVDGEPVKVNTLDFWLTTDGAATWKKMIFSNEFSPSCVRFIPNKNKKKNPNLFVAGFNRNGEIQFAQSNNQGVTWTYDTPVMNNGNKRALIYEIYGMAICNQDPNIIYASVLYYNTKPNQVVNHIIKSIDGGKTWDTVTEGAVSLPEKTTFHDIYINPNDSNIVLAGWYGDGGASHCIYRTEDGGKTWQMVVKNGYGEWAKCFTVNPLDPNIISVGTMALNNNTRHFGISRDKGLTWQWISDNLLGSGCSGIGIDLNGKYYLCTSQCIHTLELDN